MGEIDRPSSQRSIRNPRDFYGGLALIALALFALWTSAGLPGMRGFAFGSGTAPWLVATLLLVAGGVITAHGLFTDGPPLERWRIRGPVLFVTAILFFGTAIRPLGIVVTTFVTLIIAAAASREVRWIESIVWSAILTAGAVALFVYGLGLPLHLWPR